MENRAPTFNPSEFFDSLSLLGLPVAGFWPAYLELGMDGLVYVNVEFFVHLACTSKGLPFRGAQSLIPLLFFPPVVGRGFHPAFPAGAPLLLPGLKQLTRPVLRLSSPTTLLLKNYHESNSRLFSSCVFPFFLETLFRVPAVQPCSGGIVPA